MERYRLPIMEKFQKSMCIWVAYLRAIALVHQNNHWTCKGPSFYAHHLLFERVYGTAQEDADKAAERVVGLFGKDCLTMAAQAECINTILVKVNELAEPLESSIAIEEDFLDYTKKLYDLMKTEESDKMTLGLDDLMMELCSSRETAIYLLSQNLES